MRIALVSHEYPPFSGGGIGTYATLMARSFAEAGHETHVITNRFGLGSSDPTHRLDEHRDESLYGGNLWVHRVPAWDDRLNPAGAHAAAGCPVGRIGRDFSPYLYYAEAIADRIEALHARFGFDIAEFPECAAEGYGVLRRRRAGLGLTGLPVTVCCHSPIDEIYRYNLYSRHDAGFWRRKTLEDDTVRWADGVHSPSALMGRIVAERLGLTGDGKPWDVLPLPMDFSEIPEPEARRTDGPPTLFFVGRLEPRKGVRYLVDAAVRLMQAGHPELRVEMVGRDCDAGEAPGGMKDFLLARVPERFRDNLIFPGYVPREQLFARYRAATACVFAPEWDNFPYTCVEAMASGACVVGSDYSGIAEMVEDGRSGLLFRAGDTGSLAGAIRRAIEDTDLNARIRPEAMTRIRGMCDPRRAARDRVSHYERVIDHARARRMAPRPAGPRWENLRVLVLADARQDPERMLASVRGTIESVGASATGARYSARYAVAAADAGPLSVYEGDDWVTLLEVAEPGMSAARAAWAASGEALGGEALLTIRAGETVSPNALRLFRHRLANDAGLGWVSARALPAERGTEIGRGALVDFEPPLGMIDHDPMPPALVRTEAVRGAGFWDTSMPERWSDWHFRLALRESGWRGEIVPLWLLGLVPRDGSDDPREPVPPEMRAIYLERTSLRCPGLFREHGKDLWAYDLLGMHESFAAAH